MKSVLLFLVCVASIGISPKVVHAYAYGYGGPPQGGDYHSHSSDLYDYHGSTLDDYESYNDYGNYYGLNDYGPYGVSGYEPYEYYGQDEYVPYDSYADSYTVLDPSYDPYNNYGDMTSDDSYYYYYHHQHPSDGYNQIDTYDVYGGDQYGKGSYGDVYGQYGDYDHYLPTSGYSSYGDGYGHDAYGLDYYGGDNYVDASPYFGYGRYEPYDAYGYESHPYEYNSYGSNYGYLEDYNAGPWYNDYGYEPVDRYASHSGDPYRGDYGNQVSYGYPHYEGEDEFRLKKYSSYDNYRVVDYGKSSSRMPHNRYDGYEEYDSYEPYGAHDYDLYGYNEYKDYSKPKKSYYYYDEYKHDKYEPYDDYNRETYGKQKTRKNRYAVRDAVVDNDDDWKPYKPSRSKYTQKKSYGGTVERYDFEDAPKSKRTFDKYGYYSKYGSGKSYDKLDRYAKDDFDPKRYSKLDSYKGFYKGKRHGDGYGRKYNSGEKSYDDGYYGSDYDDTYDMKGYGHYGTQEDDHYYGTYRNKDKYGSGVGYGTHGKAHVSGKVIYDGKQELRADLKGEGYLSGEGSSEKGTKYEQVVAYHHGGSVDAYGKHKQRYAEYDAYGKVKQYGEENLKTKHNIEGTLRAKGRNHAYDDRLADQKFKQHGRYRDLDDNNYYGKYGFEGRRGGY